MLTREFTQNGRTTIVSVTRAEAGWDVRAEQEQATVRLAHYSDWHRVERALQAFESANPEAAVRTGA